MARSSSFRTAGDDVLLTEDIPDSSMGINTRKQEVELDGKELTECLNADLSAVGRIKKRLGDVSVLNDLGSNPIVFLRYLEAPSVANRMVHVWNKRIYKHTSPLTESGNWTDIDSTDRFTADTFSTTVAMVMAKMFVSNGTDNVFSYNGTGITDEADTNTDPPKGKASAGFQNRLWMANTDTNPDYVWYSDALDPQTFNRSTNVFKVGAGGETTKITNLVPAAQNVLNIFKEDSIYELLIQGSSASYWNLRLVESKNGCVALDCAKYYNGVIYYLARDGVRTYPAQNALPLSHNNKTLFDSINWTYINRARMEIFNNKLYLSLPVDSDTYPTRVAVLDFTTGGWQNYTGLNVGCWGIHEEGNKEYLMYGDANDGKVYRMHKSTQFNDDATAINFKIETRALNFGFPFNYKVGGEFELEISSSTGNTVTVSAAIDGGSYASLGTCTATTKFHLESLGKFKEIKFKLQNNATSTEQLIIDGARVVTFLEEYRSE